MEIDEDKFFQILNNLLSNSLKFTNDGGTIALTITDQDTSLLVTVADNGENTGTIFYIELPNGEI
ncbi:MAG: ATP-binding protein [Pedobacter sp.]|uniref:ATP-binding protein n=1 Tax=Pedobacter sp. TaxID=1411316 RepID=UPI00339A9A20